ncbi:MAG: hypothetical protein FWH22_10980, partial [Fibromonadales bacterium]|nr:hypothetical protein [Fibromonadales bacterium]
DNCHAEIDIYSTSRNVGGLVGRNWGPIRNSYAKANINSNGGQYIGGIAGDNKNAISNSHAEINIIGTGINVGGIAGDNEGSRVFIENSSVKGSIRGNYNLSGIAGNGTINNCFAEIEISGGNNLAGISLWGGANNSHAIVNINGSDNVYAISPSEWVRNSYAIGTVNGTGSNVSGISSGKNTYFAGAVNGSPSFIYRDYFDNIENFEESEIKSSDFVDLWNMNAGVLNKYESRYLALEQVAGDYPKFSEDIAEYNLNLHFASGTGTEEDPYIIESEKRLYNFRVFVNEGIESYHGKHIALGTDIALNDIANWTNWDEWSYFDNVNKLNIWTPIGSDYSRSFAGSFDGRGHIITGMYIPLQESSNCQGFFGRVNGGGTIKNIGMEAFFVAGYGSVGGLAACMENGTISNSYAIGTAKNLGDWRDGTGILAGSAANIDNSYAIGTSNGGGLAGSANSISNSYYNNLNDIDNFEKWDFITVWSVANSINDGKPHLQWQSEIGQATIVAIPPETYTGEPIKPEPSVTTDLAFEYQWGENINVLDGGWVKIVADDGSWKGVRFEILPKDAEPVFIEYNPIDIEDFSGTLTLSQIPLLPRYEWETPTEQITSKGSGQKFNAKYSDPNYLQKASGEITVNVRALITSIPIPTAIQGLEYTGSLQIGVLPGTGYAIEGNTATAVGVYKATLTLEDDYIWEDESTDEIEITWSISLATMLFPVLDPIPVNYIPFLTLQRIALPENYAWAEPETSVMVGNNQYFPAVYVAPNYEPSSGTLIVNVTKGESEGSVSIADWVYGAEASAPEAYSATNPGTPTFRYIGETNSETSYESEEAPRFPGNYTVIATFPANINYDSFEERDEFVIIKADGRGTVSMVDWYETEEASSPIPSSLTNGDVGVEYKYHGVGGLLPSKPSTAGIYDVEAIFPDNANFKSVIAWATFTILPARKIVPIPVAIEGLEYTGSERIGVLGGTGYTIENNSAINASNSYIAVASLEAGYRWEDNTLENKSIPWSIAPATRAFAEL